MAVDLNSETGELDLEKHENGESISFIKDLMQRRVLQILGIYLATSWAIIEFLDWLISRYSISPNLSEFGLVTLASMIPTVIFLAYFHGRPGRDEWTRVEKIGIPTNILGTILLLFFLFNGKDLGAATTMITFKNEEGQTIERIIPKSEFRKKIMIYFLENESGDTSLNWLSYAIIDMLDTDLVQDYYLEVRTGYHVYRHGLSVIEKMTEAGYPNGIGLPLMLEKEIADHLHMNYFLSGSFTKQGEAYSINTKLYNTKNGKLLHQNTLTNLDIFELVDEIVVQLKHDLEIPDYHINEAEDLPISEISTNSITAYKMYNAATNEISFNQDWNKALDYLKQSIREDSTLALAYIELFYGYLYTNQVEKGAWIFQPLMKHLYKLPEKWQFIAKTAYYEFNKEFDKVYAIYEMLASLYPDDLSYRLRLAQLHVNRNQLDEAIAEYKYILELDPEQYDILQKIGAIYKSRGKFEDALNYYNLYADQFPDKPESFRSIGGLHKTMGNYEKAKSSYERILLFEPGNISVLLNLADIERESGNFKQALNQYHDALGKSKTSKEKVDVYTKLKKYYELRGQMKKEMEYMYLRFDEQEKFESPLVLVLKKLGVMDRFVKLEKEDIVFQTLDSLKAQLDAPFDKMIYLGYMYLYLELGEIDNAEKAISEINRLIEELKWEILQPVILNGRGQISEFRGEYKQAIRNYSEQLILQPTASKVNIHIARCYRMIKDFKKSEEYVQKTLAIHPFWPEVNYEMALIYYNMGKKEKALEYLNNTLKIWEDAEPEFEKAREAQELMDIWESDQ